MSKLIKIITEATFYHTYVVKVDDDVTVEEINDLANDCIDGKIEESFQRFAGEDFYTEMETREEEYLIEFDKNNEYASWWEPAAKMKYIFDARKKKETGTEEE